MALLFYAVSWTVNEYGEAAWYIGVGLPWLSLFVAIITRFVSDFVFHIDFSKYGWGYFYAFSAIVYVVVMSVYARTIIPFIPHLAACVSFLSATFIDLSYSDFKKKDKER